MLCFFFCATLAGRDVVVWDVDQATRGDGGGRGRDQPDGGGCLDRRVKRNSLVVKSRVSGILRPYEAIHLVDCHLQAVVVEIRS